MSSCSTEVDQLIRSACSYQTNRVAVYDRNIQPIEPVDADVHGYLIDGVMINLTERVAMVVNAMITDKNLVSKPKDLIPLGGTIPEKYTQPARLPLYYDYGFSHYGEFSGCMIYLTFQQRRHGLLRSTLYFVEVTKTRVIVVHDSDISFETIQLSISSILKDYPDY